MALVYLSGYTLATAVNIATNSTDDQSPLFFKPLDHPSEQRPNVSEEREMSNVSDLSLFSDINKTQDSICDEV